MITFLGVRVRLVGLTFLKVSHEALLDEGRAESEEPEQLIAAMRELRSTGAEVMVVSRAEEPALVWLPEGLYEVHAPRLQQVDTRWVRGFDDGRGGSLSRHRQLLGGGGADGCRSRSAERDPARARHRWRG